MFRTGESKMFTRFYIFFKERFYFNFIFGCTGSSLLRALSSCGVWASFAVASLAMEHGL